MKKNVSRDYSETHENLPWKGPERSHFSEVTELLSRIWSFLKKITSLIFSGDVRRTAVLKVSENFEKNVISSKYVQDL